MTVSGLVTISLLVGDRADRNLLAEFLAHKGYRVETVDTAELLEGRFAGFLVIVDEAKARQVGPTLFEARNKTIPVYTPLLLLMGPKSAAAPWLQNGFDDVLRMPMGKEELLVRLQAFLRLRDFGEAARRASEHFMASTLDALPQHVCVLNLRGDILLVNRAWRNFASENGLSKSNWKGVNYFAACEASAARGSGDAYAFLEGAREVATRARHSFSFEYTCDSPREKRWFLAKVTRFAHTGTDILVVSHENISVTRLAENHLAQLAHYDTLTGLPNRAYFYDSLSRALMQAKRSKWLLAVLFIDLDRFKMVNDTMGHRAGDEVLREVAERISGCLRASDVAGRLGGDEFCVYLPALSKEQDAGLVAGKIVKSLSEPILLQEGEAFVSASIGVTLYPHDATDVDSLLNAADTAMYWAKDLGRGNFQYFTARMNHAALERAAIESGLRKALERHELFLVYQPQVTIRTGTVSGCEALLRWNHPERGLVLPDSFIPIAEDTGLIVEIGAWALRTACAQNKVWHDAGYESLVVTVNLSARQLKNDELFSTVSAVLQETGLDGRFLELEVTEGIFMEDVDRLVVLMHRLKLLGIRLSIDDFGTGYSNLGYLMRFPLDAIKIDKSFIKDIGGDGKQSQGLIANTILALGHNLGLKVIAEGVETQDQLGYLHQAGCDVIQGYWFCRAVDAGAVCLVVDALEAAPPQL
ncbi:MAG: domain S-box/diguanylate cyclase protein [Paucimonas sp.]|nr:domain S-box/diguanylate cyclase protein [Paucimonas sp.]